jgi:hypothetical protein
MKKRRKDKNVLVLQFIRSGLKSIQSCGAEAAKSYTAVVESGPI